MQVCDKWVDDLHQQSMQPTADTPLSISHLTLPGTDNPSRIKASLQPVVEMLAAGTLKHAHPLEAFPVSRLEDALRFMQGGKHPGKLVKNLTSDDLVSVSAPSLI